MLRMFGWMENVNNETLYGDLSKLTSKIDVRLRSLAGHCLRHHKLPASQLVIWELSNGRMNPGRPPKTMIKTLLEDSGAALTTELRSLMLGQDVWRV